MEFSLYTAQSMSLIFTTKLSDKEGDYVEK